MLRLRALVALFIMLFSLAFINSSFAADSVGNQLADVLRAKGVLDEESYNKIKNAPPAAATPTLLNVLREKGVLSEEDYNKLSAQAQAAPAPVAEAAPAAGAERPFDKSLSSLEEGFARLSGDNVKLRIGALFQAGWLYDDSGIVVGSPPTSLISNSSNTTHIDNSFFVRRARLFFNGQLSDKTGFKISIEGTQTPVLQDAYAYFDYIPYARVTAGQFKTPFSVEQAESIGDNPTVNRSLVTNMVVNPQLRDDGVMLSGAYQIREKAFGVGYATALFNGTGKNTIDDNNRKDWTGRVWISPFVPGLTLGGAWYAGETNNKPGKRDRQKWGADFEYDPPMVQGLRVRGEFEWERRFYDTFTSKDIFNTTTPNTFGKAGRFAHTFGYYLLAWYRVNGLNGGLRYLNGFEPLVRYDTLDEDTTLPDNARDRWTVGMNYYLNKYTRIMADWEIIHADGSLAKNSLEKIDLKGHHLFTTVFQVKF